MQFVLKMLVISPVFGIYRFRHVDWHTKRDCIYHMHEWERYGSKCEDLAETMEGYRLCQWDYYRLNEYRDWLCQTNHKVFLNLTARCELSHPELVSQLEQAFKDECVMYVRSMDRKDFLFVTLIGFLCFALVFYLIMF